MFGTDGIRARVGSEWVNPQSFFRLGFAIANTTALFAQDRAVVVARDTRESSQMLQRSLMNGLRAGGIDVIDYGVLPTPVLSYLTQLHTASVGLMVTASHNLYHDNGLKIFQGNGCKLSDQQQTQLFNQYQRTQIEGQSSQLQGEYTEGDCLDAYVDYCVSQFAPILTGLKGHIVCDCAHGATTWLVPMVLNRLGISFTSLSVSPNGKNINDQCGSTDLAALQSAVLAQQATLGVAFDGDGDRVLMVDATGAVIDGDHMLYGLVQYHRSMGITVPGVVGTVMSNQALVHALQQQGVPFKRVMVGDRHVVSKLRQHHWRFGSEPSGHVVDLAYANTGDGMVTMLQWLAWMAKTGETAETLRQRLCLCHQVLINVPINPGYDFKVSDKLTCLQNQIHEQIANRGRLLLRASGTEPVLRVMVEGDDLNELQQLGEMLATAIADDNV